MQRILVTGGCGLIGDHVCSGFLKKGFEVVAVDRQCSEYNVNKENFIFYEAKPTEKGKYADIFEKYKFDTVIHLACTADNDLGHMITEEQIKENEQCNTFIYRFSIAHDVKQFILISTTQVYQMPKTREQLREDDFVKPQTNYSKLKYDSEQAMIRDIGRAKGMMVAILRLAPVYTKSFSANLEAKITDPKDNTKFVYRTGEYGFHMCCVHNLVDFLLTFVQSAEDNSYSGIYNMADKNLTMASEIIEYMKEHHRIGVILQRNPPNTSLNMIKNLIDNKDMKVNYRFLDFTRILTNNMFDISKAAKYCSFRWTIRNTK
ncbi:MAG: NAD-dependent epimerase/dehydratase family protein [Oscillospiraceae bacterium]|nr:NAD-dependent epimerase/dehydratase family protein [Oscillospiraceae bacterium]